MKFNVSVFINDKCLDYRQPIDDPFINSTITISKWDLFKGLFRKKFTTNIVVSGDMPTINKIMNQVYKEMN